MVLFNLDHLYEEKDVVQEGEQWLPASKQWPPKLRARLYAKLANYDDAKADDYALQAVRLDENVTIAPARLGRAWLNAGQPTKAAEAIEDMMDSDYAPYRALRFDIALARKDWPAAVAAIDATDTSQLYPNLKRFGQLAVAAPSTLLSGQMPLMLFVVIAMGLGLAAIPLLLLVPVHYRGVARRLQHRISQAPLPRVTLWHAWYGAALALAVPTVLMVFVAPQLLDGGAERMGPALFSLMLWSMCVSLLAMVPVLGVFGRRGLLGDRDVWRASWKRILGYWAVLLVIVFALNALFTVTGMDTSTEQTKHGRRARRTGEGHLGRDADAVHRRAARADLRGTGVPRPVAQRHGAASATSAGRTASRRSCSRACTPIRRASSSISRWACSAVGWCDAPVRSRRRSRCMCSTMRGRSGC